MKPNPTPLQLARRRLLLSIALVLTGTVVILIGVAFIFWPAALILAGGALVGSTFLINVVNPEPPKR